MYTLRFHLVNTIDSSHANENAARISLAASSRLCGGCRLRGSFGSTFVGVVRDVPWLAFTQIELPHLSERQRSCPFAAEHCHLPLWALSHEQSVGSAGKGISPTRPKSITPEKRGERPTTGMTVLQLPSVLIFASARRRFCLRVPGSDRLSDRQRYHAAQSPVGRSRCQQAIFDWTPVPSLGLIVGAQTRSQRSDREA